MHRQFSWMTVVLVLLHAGNGTIHAQEIAGTFDQLRVLVKPGDRITVTDDTGRETSGRIAELSPLSLALIVGDERRDLSAGDINTIRQRRSDPLANGAKWGFAVGAGLGLLTGIAVTNEYDDDVDAGFVVFATLIYGGLGAGVGVGVDALISGDQIIYARRAASSARVVVKPLLIRQRRGVAVAIGF